MLTGERCWKATESNIVSAIPLYAPNPRLLQKVVDFRGVLTANPELRDAGSTQVANFTLAFNFSWGKGDDQKRDTAFVECEETTLRQCWQREEVLIERCW